MFERPNLGGRERPCSPDWLGRSLSQSGEHGLSRPHTICHVICLSTASHAHRVMQSDPRGRLTDFMAKRIASAGVRERPIGTSDSHGLTDLRGRSDSQICEAVGGRSVRPIGLSDRSHDFLSRPHRSASQICLRVRSERPCGRPIGLSRTPGQSHLYRLREYDPRARLTDFTAKCIASPGVRERPIGLTDRTLKSVRPCSDSHGLSHSLTDHRSDSLTDLTMWQIWQIHFIAI